jgi:D-inositol-3-phosphate glycosyltransferase
MKIALVTLQGNPFAPGGRAGPDSHDGRLAALAPALAARGHQVTLYTRRDAPAAARRAALPPGVHLVTIPAGPPERLRASAAAPHAAEFGRHLARLWQDEMPDVVHAHFWTGGLAALAAARGPGLPVVQTFLGLAAPGPARTGRTPLASSASSAAASQRLRLEPVIARSAAAVLASSSSEMTALGRLGVPRESVTMIPRGVNTARFTPEGPVAPRTRRPRLLCVAPLAGRDGLDVAVRALAEIPEAELVIAGGPERSKLPGDPACQALTRLAAEVGAGDRVVFHGRVRDDGLPALLRSADLLLEVAAQEPFASVALEAMACGVPVVASAVGSHRDTVVHGTTGLLVAPGSAVLLANRVRALLASPMKLEGFGIAALDRATSRYSWDRIGQETLAVYGAARGAGPGAEPDPAAATGAEPAAAPGAARPSAEAGPQPG